VTVAGVPPERPVHLLAADARHHAVLVEGAPEGAIRLPLIGSLGDVESHRPIAALVEHYLGADHPVMRVLPAGRDAGGRATDVLVWAEPVAGDVPEVATWVPLGDPRLDGLRDAASIGPDVSRWLDELATGDVDPRRQRWERPGFQAEATEWMLRELEAAGTPAVGTPTVEKLWPIAAMLRSETTAGPAFMKACARLFDVEPAATTALHRVIPEAVPAVIATDAAEGWLLLRGVDGTDVELQPQDTWAAALCTLATIQQASGRGLDGVALEDRGPAALAAALPALFESTYVADLPDDVGPRFLAAAPRLLEACQRLASLGPGLTVMHGDFHAGNALQAGDDVVIIDWSDIAIGHPFMDLATWLNRVDDPAARRSMVDAWLDRWADAAPRVDLEEAVRLALPVGSLHQVESYRRIFASLEPGSNRVLASGGAYFARWALAWLDDGLDATVPRRA